MRKRQPAPDAPADEMLLAVALAEANARELKPFMGDFFADANGGMVAADYPHLRACCAMGALLLAGVAQADAGSGNFCVPAPFDADSICRGNDDSIVKWDDVEADRGETLGHAFQLAMGGYQGRRWFK